jgi:hypothetical protein
MTDTQADLVALMREREQRLRSNLGAYSPDELPKLARKIFEEAEFFKGVADELERLRASNKQMADTLQEADEILTGEGWHTDRGLLSRIRAARRAALKDAKP